MRTCLEIFTVSFNYLTLIIIISSILFYIWTIPHKTSYLWVGYNWSIVKSTLAIGNKILPPSLEKSLCLFLSSSYRTWKSRTLVESILGICQRELQTVITFSLISPPWELPTTETEQKGFSFCFPPALLPSWTDYLGNKKCRNKHTCLWTSRLWCSIYNLLFCLSWPQILLFNFI